MSVLTGPIIALLVSITLLWGAQGLMFSLLALRLDADGFSALAVGLVTTGYFAGQLAGALVCGRIIERVGHVRSFAAFASIISATAVFFPLHVDVWSWTASRFVQGVCIAGTLMVAESWLNGATSNAKRGQLLAIYTVLQYVAMSGGQQLLNLAAPSEFILFCLASILLSFSLVPLSLASGVSAAEIPPSGFSIRELVRISPLGVVGAGAGGLLVGSFLGFLPIYLGERGYGLGEIATFMSAVILGGLLVQYPIGKASDLFDRRTVITVTLFAGGAVAAVVGFGGAVGYWPVLVLSVLFGGISYSIYPLAVSHANDFIDPVDLVAASAGLILAMAVGATAGPLATASAMEVLGPAGLFVFLAVVCVAVGGFAVFRMTRRAAPLAEDQGPYVLVPRSTVAAAELDPRGEVEHWDEGVTEPYRENGRAA